MAPAKKTPVYQRTQSPTELNVLKRAQTNYQRSRTIFDLRNRART